MFPQRLAALAAQVVPSRGVPLLGIGLHVPTLPVRVQLWHAPPQALLQHTPSGPHTPVLQSLVARQGAPAGKVFPQRLVVLRQLRPPAQSPSLVHVVRHDGLVVLHTKGLHIEVDEAAQLPRPSQLAAGVKVLPLQLACRQPVDVDQGRHAPAPLHVPSFPQFPLDGLVATHRPRGSAPPDATGEQVPTLPETLQLMQVPALPEASVQAELQHTPSVQKAEAHWLPAVHEEPAGFSPHELLLPQVLEPTQSVVCVAAVHEVRHDFFEASQVKVPHERVAGTTHAPLPSQVEAGVTEELVAHAAAPQFWPLGQKAQLPPLHMPVCPQLDIALVLHRFCGSGLPSGTAVQMPAEPVRLQAMQAPLQAALQHTPWAQKPDRHSDPPPQSAPMGCLPHDPLTQLLGGRHCVASLFEVQVLAHFEPLHW